MNIIGFSLFLIMCGVGIYLGLTLHYTQFLTYWVVYGISICLALALGFICGYEKNNKYKKEDN